MKKTLIALLAVMLVAVACCAVASAEVAKKCPVCGADMFAAVTTEPTCCKAGSITYHCTNTTEHPSGTVLEDTVNLPATGNHNWVQDGEAKEPAYCGDCGSVAFKCSNAGCTATMTKPASTNPKPHVFANGWKLYTAATCSELGVYIRECTQTNADGTPCTYHEFKKDGPLAEHTWVDVVLQEESCKAKTGKIWYQKCKVCGAKKEDSLKSTPAPEHKWMFENDVEWTPATCTTAGVAYNKCSVCGTTTQKALPALGHLAPDASLIKIKTKATCLTKGVRTYKCDRCKKDVEETLGYGDHQWVEQQVTGVETIKTRTCKVCGRSQYLDMYNGGWKTSIKGKSIADNMLLADKPNCNGVVDGTADHSTAKKTATKAAKASAASTKANGNSAPIPATNDNTSTLPFVMMGIALVGIVALIASKRKVNG